MCFKYCDSFPRLFDAARPAARRRRHASSTRTRRGRSWTPASSASCARCSARTRRATGTSSSSTSRSSSTATAACSAREAAHRCAQRVLNDPDARRQAGARCRSGMANVGEPLAAAPRPHGEGRSAIHRDKLLPGLRRRAVRRAGPSRTATCRPEPGGEAVLFQTCFVQHNEPEIGKDALYVLRRRTASTRACVKGLALLRHARLGARRPRGAARARRATTSTCSCPYVEKGAKVLVVNPTCSMMMRREWPHLLDGAGPRARRAARAPR